jgi:hypothetical protein
VKGDSPIVVPGTRKVYSFPIAHLRDGHRGVGRNVYWTEPGEYTLTATYRLSDQDGGQGPLLTSRPVKLKVEDKK